MTENEIKQALPFLAKYCKQEYNDIRVDEVLLGASDIIREKNAESERLRKELNIVSTLYQDEQERYKELLDGKCDRCIARDKAEAIKEFAERLKKTFHIEEIWNGEDEYCYETIDYEDIDNLVKEMVGDME